MTPNYVYSESTVKPSSIEVKKNYAYLRKDIIKEEREDMDGNTITYWTYQEAFMPIDDFNAYVEETSLLNTIENIGSNDNQMAIMEAIADIYSILETLV